MVTDYFDALEARVKGISSCSELAEVATDVTKQVTDLQAGILANLDKIAPLMTPPKDLPSVIKWIKAAVGPYQAAAATLIAESALITAKSAALLAALSSKAATMQCSGNTVPPPPTPPVLPTLP